MRTIVLTLAAISMACGPTFEDEVDPWAEVDEEGASGRIGATKQMDEGCVFNWECADELVCRPTSGEPFAPKTCRDKAWTDEFPDSWCDHTWDCAESDAVCSRISWCTLGPCEGISYEHDARVCVKMDWIDWEQ
jgi:hypothetical protein